MPALDIVIVNWNSWDLLCECLRSVAAADKDGFQLNRVVIVDNASENGIKIDSLNSLNLPLAVICNKKNMGFAAACNQGARGSSANYLLFLNPDTCLYKDSLTRPVAFMERVDNRRIGITGIQLRDQTNRVTASCARFPAACNFIANATGLDRIAPKAGYIMRDWDHGSNKIVDHVIGAFYLVRHELFVLAGGFDERFFVYLEDLDFSLRARRLGWKSYYLAEAKAYHAGGGVSSQAKDRRLFYSLRSRLLYAFKHFSRPDALTLTLVTIVIEPWIRLLLALARRTSGEAASTLRAYFMLLAGLPEIFASDQKGRYYQA